MDQMSDTACRLRGISSQLNDLEEEFKAEGQYDCAHQVSEAEGYVRGLLSLPEPGEV